MKIIGVVDSTISDDNSHTLVKVALKYVKTLDVDTEILAVDDIDFTKEKSTKELESKIDEVDAILIATTFDVDNDKTDIDPFLKWFDTVGKKDHLKAGTMLLVEPYDSLKEYNEKYLVDILSSKGVSIVLNRVFTKLKESADARSNTYILTQAMEVGEVVAQALKA